MSKSYRENDQQNSNSIKDETSFRQSGSEANSWNASDIQTWLISKLSKELSVDPDEINPKEPFMSYGISSGEAVIISGELEDWLGMQLSPTLLYEYPNIESLSRFLASKPADSIQDSSDPALPSSNDAIAIIGIGCRFPNAKNPKDFWQLLRDGVDAIIEIPENRWDLQAFYDADPTAPGKMNSRWGAFLDDIEKFDAGFFSISPREAERMDPQQRLLLEVALEALDDAGQSLESLVNIHRNRQ
jgi:acyl carrier protein